MNGSWTFETDCWREAPIRPPCRRSTPMTAVTQPAAGSGSTGTLEPPEEDSITEPRLPGEGSMWLFVLGDMVIFAIYFSIYMVMRHKQPALFLASQQHLNETTGLIDTLVLLTSSWFVARAVLATRAGAYQAAMRFTVGGFACGVLFIIIKMIEWSREISHGYTLPKNYFFMFYFMLTGVHLLHVLLGLLILGIVYRELRDPTLRRMPMVESGATFWHMVDLLWIVIFALLYVMR
jgi:nitric oxide reductase NorE protein